MRRVIRKRIRRSEDGLDLAIDFNADVVVNTGRSQSVPAEPEESEPDDSARPEVNETEKEDS